MIDLRNYEKKPVPISIQAQIRQILYQIYQYRLSLLLFCIIILWLSLNFESKFFPAYFPIFLLVVLIALLLFYSYQNIKFKVSRNCGHRYDFIFEFIESLFSTFSINRQTIITDSYQARRNPRVINAPHTYAHEAPTFNSSVSDFNKTIPDKEPIQNMIYQNQENINYLNTIKSKEKRRNISTEPIEIKKNINKINEMPAGRNQNYMPSMSKNIRGTPIF